MKYVYANNVTDWFVAETVQHAKKLARQFYKDTSSDIPEDELDMDFRRVPDDKILTMDTGDKEPVRKTARQFADDNECGFLMSSEY